jgi:hypothetical protein
MEIRDSTLARATSASMLNILKSKDSTKVSII